MKFPEEDEEGCIPEEEEEDAVVETGFYEASSRTPTSQDNLRTSSSPDNNLISVSSAASLPYETGASAPLAPGIKSPCNRTRQPNRLSQPRQRQTHRPQQDCVSVSESDNEVPSTDVLMQLSSNSLQKNASPEPVRAPSPPSQTQPMSPWKAPSMSSLVGQPMMVFVPTVQGDGSVTLMPTWTTTTQQYMPSLNATTPMMMLAPPECLPSYAMRQETSSTFPGTRLIRQDATSGHQPRPPPPPPPPPLIDPYAPSGNNATPEDPFAPSSIRSSYAPRKPYAQQQPYASSGVRPMVQTFQQQPYHCQPPAAQLATSHHPGFQSHSTQNMSLRNGQAPVDQSWAPNQQTHDAFHWKGSNPSDHRFRESQNFSNSADYSDSQSSRLQNYTPLAPVKPPPPPRCDAIDQQARLGTHTSMSSYLSLHAPPAPLYDARPEFFCDVCDRDFRSKDRHDLHLAEDHVPCEHCEWTGPPSLLLAHNLTHIRGKDGEVICRSKAEEETWIAARRKRREIKMQGGDPKKVKIPMSELEAALRDSLRVKKVFKTRLNANLLRRHAKDSGVLPQAHAYVRMYEAKRTETFEGPELGRSDQCRIWQEFNICEAFLRHRKCRFGSECNRSHDIKRYQEWCINRIKSGIRVKFRHYNSKALLYKLTCPEVAKYEATLLKCFKVLHKNHFWLGNTVEVTHHDHGSLGNSPFGSEQEVRRCSLSAAAAGEAL